jgi:ubiquinone/menaquinone biosynthesis C-methylase UbiE
MTLPSNDHGKPTPKAHWEDVHASRAPTELSWYQSRPTRSLELMEQFGSEPSTAFIDVGGGASTLVDALLDRGLRSVTVLDISHAALEHAKARLGPRAARVTWVEADITRIELGSNAYDVWHDRALFHFLTDRLERQRYVDAAARAIRPGGIALIVTFALHGPPRCSGIDVVRYSPELLAREFGTRFSFERSEDELHRTPSGGTQAFTYTVLRRQ